MGIIIAKLRGKQSTYEVLTKLDNEIASIEAFQKSTEEARRKIIFRFVLLAVLIYIITGILLYLYFAHSPTNQKLYCGATLVAFPIVIWMIKQLLTWYYNRKIKRKQNKLVQLKEQKQKLLDNVMETETYKVAKKILDKFGSERERPVEATPLANRTTALVSSAMNPNNTVLRHRTLAAQSSMRGRISFGGLDTPINQKQSLQTPGPLPTIMGPPIGIQSASRVPTGTPLPLPRGILPRDRSVLDKMMDYLVGDGPSNRYALICRECHSHNGMAAMDEFEYLSFRCCYCTAFNPARKKKPSRPKLEATTTTIQTKSSSTESSSDSEEKSASELKIIKPSTIEQNRSSDSPDTVKTSETFDKLSDLELKSSDNDISPMPMDVDSPESKSNILAEEPDADDDEDDSTTRIDKDDSESTSKTE